MPDTPLNERDDVRERVRQKYGRAALLVLEGKGAACCGGGNVGTGKAGASTSSGESCRHREVQGRHASGEECCHGEGHGHASGEECCPSDAKDAISTGLYDSAQAADIPEAALLASLGCGNPTALADLREGEVVLDLGSGGGIDVLLSARRVGPHGFAYGLDMTDEMLELAERNRVEVGAENVRFLKGHIEAIPLPDASVDVLISNCVINLSDDKPSVLREAHRVLKPGGRFAVSDIVVEAALPEALRRDMEAYAGCVAGALEKAEYLRLLREAGFAEATIEPTRRYTYDDLAATVLTPAAVAALTAEEKTALEGRVMSAFIHAVK